MAQVVIDGGILRIDLTVPERVVSLHGASVSVPLAQIRAVRVVRDVLGQVRGLRTPGAGVPGILAIGVWRGLADGRRFQDFVVVHRPGPGLVITTSGRYDRMLIGSDDPKQLAAELAEHGLS